MMLMYTNYYSFSFICHSLNHLLIIDHLDIYLYKFAKAFNWKPLNHWFDSSVVYAKCKLFFFFLLLQKQKSIHKIHYTYQKTKRTPSYCTYLYTYTSHLLNKLMFEMNCPTIILIFLTFVLESSVRQINFKYCVCCIISIYLQIDLEINHFVIY